MTLNENIFREYRLIGMAQYNWPPNKVSLCCKEGK